LIGAGVGVLVPYDQTNYQWVLGALLQGLIAALVLGLTGFLVVAQVVQNATPRTAIFLPLRLVFALSTAVLAMVLLDLGALLTLYQKVSDVHRIIATVIAAANVL